MVTYSDDYDALDIHGWNYYLIDDIFSLFMHCPWYLEWLRYALITHRYFLCRKYADRSRAGPSDGLAANPFMDDSCAMRKCGSWTVRWWSNDVTIVYCIHLHMEVCFD